MEDFEALIELKMNDSNLSNCLNSPYIFIKSTANCTAGDSDTYQINLLDYLLRIRSPTKLPTIALNEAQLSNDLIEGDSLT